MASQETNIMTMVIICTVFVVIAACVTWYVTSH